MNKVFKSLAITFSLVFLMASYVTTVNAAAWVGHKFMLELPTGEKKDLRGAKIHIYHQSPEGGFNGANNTCYYPEMEAINENPDWANKVKEAIGDSFCGTPSSCSFADFGAPYLSNDFDDDRDVYANPLAGGQPRGIYEKDNASYKAFYGKTFSAALGEDGPFKYLANKYERGNIRGFAGAKWQGNVDWTETEEGKGPVRLATQEEITMLNGTSQWGNNIRFLGPNQRWDVGEVYRDPLGGNVLHARITWVLKAPDAPPQTEQPTASLAGRCATNTPGVPSYTYTLSNIDLKGQEFASTHLHLKIPKSGMSAALINEMKAFLGDAIYEDGNTFDYSLIFYTQPAPTNNSLTLQVLPSEIVGNIQPNNTEGKRPNTKTVQQFVDWLDQKRIANVPVPSNFEIATNLESKDASGNNRVLNSYISATFRPRLATNECGQPTGGGPACVSIQMQDNDSNPITNIGALVPGDRVKFACGQVSGVAQYGFRVVRFDAQGGQVGQPIALAPDSDKPFTSEMWTIPADGGKFTAQCALCQNGNCEFEIPNYNTPDPTPIPTSIPCPEQYSCVSAAGCLEVASGNFTCPVAGNVCCANRRRDE